MTLSKQMAINDLPDKNTVEHKSQVTWGEVCESSQGERYLVYINI